jgi:hypothetical protein
VPAGATLVATVKDRQTLLERAASLGMLVCAGVTMMRCAMRHGFGGRGRAFDTGYLGELSGSSALNNAISTPTTPPHI